MTDSDQTHTAWKAEVQRRGCVSHVLVFELPEGILILDHTGHLDLPRPPGVVRVYIAPSDMDVSRKSEIQVPKPLYEAALAAYAAQKQFWVFDEFLRQ